MCVSCPDPDSNKVQKDIFKTKRENRTWTRC